MHKGVFSARCNAGPCRATRYQWFTVLVVLAYTRILVSWCAWGSISFLYGLKVKLFRKLVVVTVQCKGSFRASLFFLITEELQGFGFGFLRLVQLCFTHTTGFHLWVQRMQLLVFLRLYSHCRGENGFLNSFSFFPFYYFFT